MSKEKSSDFWRKKEEQRRLKTDSDNLKARGREMGNSIRPANTTTTKQEVSDKKEEVTHQEGEQKKTLLAKIKKEMTSKTTLKDKQKNEAKEVSQKPNRLITMVKREARVQKPTAEKVKPKNSPTKAK